MYRREKSVRFPSPVQRRGIVTPLGFVVVLMACTSGCRKGAPPGPAAGLNKAGRPSAEAVALLSGPTNGNIGVAFRGLLVREVVRQSFLIAARDGAGRPTRDGVLREALPSTASLKPMESRFFFQAVSDSWLEIERPRNLGNELLLKQPFRIDASDGQRTLILPKLVAQAEAWSRTKFVDTLRDINYQIDGGQSDQVGGVGVEVEQCLSQMDPLAQFAALRRLHAQIRAEGESTERLAELCRAYALLGALTESRFSPVHKVFKARALLYAERSVASRPTSPLPLWSRAFVRSLVGVHQLAMDDIEAANKLAAASPESSDAGRPPRWLEPVDAYCHFDDKRLAAETGPNAPLAALLRLFIAESSQSLSLILETAQTVLKSSPNCDRALDPLVGDSGTLGTRRMAATVGRRVVSGRLQERLSLLPDLPAAIKNALGADVAAAADDELDATDPIGGGMAQCAELIKRLRGAVDEDIGEPSWGALATLLEDANFTQVWREFTFHYHSLGNGDDGPLAEWRSLVVDHPLKDAIGEAATEDGMATVPEDMRTFDFEPREVWLLSHAKPFGKKNDNAFWKASENVDWTYADLLLRHRLRIQLGTRGRFVAWEQAHLKDLLRISPFSPQSVALFIADGEEDSVKDRIDEWEKKYAEDGTVQFALGKRYKELKQNDAAERCLQRAVALLPEKRHYEELATLYAERGDRQRWQSTLEDFLKQPSYGLEDDNVRVQLANYFASRHEWHKSLEFAEKAAQSYAAWAMLAAARAHEALGQWQEAERWYQATSYQYASEGLAWYLFCKRTGQGDLATARDVAANTVQSMEPGLKGKDLWRGVALNVLEGRPAAALELAERMFRDDRDTQFMVLAALVADEANEAATRDRLLKDAEIHQLSDKPYAFRDEEPQREYIYLASAFAHDLAQGGKAELELDNIDQLLSRAAENRRVAGQFLVGYYLALHGKPDTAAEYFKHAMVSSPGLVFRTFAGQRLLAMGMGPDAYLPALSLPIDDIKER
ncbi:MAG TPA: tetratricopeptide repeat protein [Pirellulales bacterium]|nr:tetratricopeptide repeat protein [Pirellulales bacterium]